MGASAKLWSTTTALAWIREAEVGEKQRVLQSESSEALLERKAGLRCGLNLSKNRQSQA